MYIIGIAGGSGSGKTTFANKLLGFTPNNICILHMDSYYLPKQPGVKNTKHSRPNYDHPDAFDWKLLIKDLKRLKEGKKIEAPVYDFTTSTRTNKTRPLGPVKIVLFEGIFTLYQREIRDMLDIKCYLYVDSDIRFIRRLYRDVKDRGRTLESVIKQYYETVRPMYQKYLAPQRQYADFIVGEETDLAASILGAKINDLLNATKFNINKKNNQN